MDPRAYRFCNRCNDPECSDFGNCRKSSNELPYVEGDPEGLNNDLEEDKDDINEIDQLGRDFDENLTYGVKQPPQIHPDDDDESESATSKDLTMEEARNKIRIVFKYYASYGDRLNMSYIQASKVVKMMKDSSVIQKGSVTKKDVDILFLKVNKSKPNMYFDDFVKFLYSLSTIKYELEPTEAFRLFLHNHIFPQ